MRRLADVIVAIALVVFAIFALGVVVWLGLFVLPQLMRMM